MKKTFKFYKFYDKQPKLNRCLLLIQPGSIKGYGHGACSMLYTSIRQIDFNPAMKDKMYWAYFDLPDIKKTESTQSHDK